MKDRIINLMTKTVFNKYFIQLLFTAIPTILLIVIPMQFSFLDPVTKAFKNFSLTDLYQQFMTKESLRQSNEIYVLDISQIKGRDKIANVIKSLDDVNPKVIGLDVLFRQHGPSLSNEDVILKNTIDSLKSSIVFGYEFLSDEGDVKESFFVSGNNKLNYSGFTNSTIYSKNEVLRTFFPCKNINGTIYDSFVLKIIESYNPNKVYCTTDELMTNYTDAEIKKIYPEDISPLLSDKIVLIGIDNGFEDVIMTPIGNKSGVMVHAYNVYNMLHNNYIRNIHWWLDLLVSLFITGFAIWMCNFIGRRFNNISNFTFSCFLWLYTILMAFINIGICFTFRLSIPFTLSFISFIFIGTAYELQNAIFNRKKLNQ